MKSVTLRVNEARRIKDPNFPDAVEHLFTVDVLDLPRLPIKEANPREQNTNRRVYKDVAKSLRNEDGAPNAFLGKNLGIYACAKAVEKVGDDEYRLDFGTGDSILDGQDGVLNGGHTAQVIWENQADLRQAREEGEDIRQYVRLYVRQGYPRDYLAETAGTLNTAVQVQEYSLAEHQDKFEWIHQALSDKPYEDKIAFKENVLAPFYVTDILSMLVLFDTVEYPNQGGAHPTGAYREKSVILKRYLNKPEQFQRLEPILDDVLRLHDLIASEGADKYNEYFAQSNDPTRKRGRAASLEWVETRGRGTYEFPFTQTEGERKLNRAAIYPALAAFRWMVEEGGAKASWKGGFATVEKAWNAVGPELMKLTQDTSLDNGRKTMAIGKSATHYNALHSAVAKYQLLTRG